MTLSDPMRFSFPRLRRVQLHAFSLYSLQPDVALPLRAGVTCMAGANGIGKSTFLSTINYGLTGCVPDPRRRFLSAAAYMKEASDFNKDFFEGRIAEADRGAAAISLDFDVGERQYSITRGLFDGAALRKCQITHKGEVVVSTEMYAAAHADAAYRENLCKDIGLSSFEQFVFVQHFLLTFDESRHLVFWDEKVSSALLYLCFGGDPDEAAKADTLNREMEKSGSRGRNLQYQAANLSKRIEILEKSLGSPGSAAPEGEQAEAFYRALDEAARVAMKNSEEASTYQSDAELRMMQASAAVEGLRASYATIFDRFVNGAASARQHPLVQVALNECKCPVCSAADTQVASRIEAALAALRCPLCDAQLPGGANDPTDTFDPVMQAQLEEVDQKLVKGRQVLEEAVAILERHKNAAVIARQKVASAYESIASFEEMNRQLLVGVRARMAAEDGPVGENLKALRTARTEQLAERDKEYAQRDKFRDQLRELQRQLEKRYVNAEREFVPRFRKLAELFLGIDLNISLATNSTAGMYLALEMRGASRRQQHQLSESQRFFVDIALRMALAQHVSNDNSPAGLFVDTPEGSLDIAYEDRAGEMFAQFVQSGHDLMMTANINSSKLLRRLATNCSAEKMQIVPMTGWTELSDVQQGASEMFRDAFTEIEAALHEPARGKTQPQSDGHVG